MQQNKHRDLLLSEGEVQNMPRDEFADKTDLDLPGFRYVVGTSNCISGFISLTSSQL